MKFFSNAVCPNTTLTVLFLFVTKLYVVYLFPRTKRLIYSVVTGLWGILPGTD